MAAGYTVLDSYKTVQVLSPQTVVDIQYITSSTTPTGITFSYAMPVSEWKAGPPYLVLDQIAVELENLVTNNHVVAGSAVQDLDSNGLLVDYVDLIVQLDRSGAGLAPLQGTVSIPMGQISLEATDPSIYNASGLPTPESQVMAEYARLEALAAG